MKEAVATAIKMETDAIAFYQEAANKTKHPFGREMFLGFVKDETRHLNILQEVLKGMNIDYKGVRPKDAIKTVFTMFKDEMMQRVKALDNEIEAVNIAMRLEKEGYDFYKKTAEQATEEKEKQLFERLAVEENDHYTILSETSKFLDNTGQWYMYEERGILEG